MRHVWLFALLICGSVLAEEQNGESDRKDGGVTYSGIGLSRVSTDFDNLSEAINLDGVLGIRVPTIDWVAAEIGVSATVIPGDNDGRTASSGGGLGGGGGGGTCVIPGVLPPGCTTGGGGGGGSSSTGNFTRSEQDYGVNILSVQLVLKNPGLFYGVGKAGYRYINSNLEEFSEKASGNAYALGVGYRYNENGGVELLYSKYSDLLDGITLSVSYGFGKDEDRFKDEEVK